MTDKTKIPRPLYNLLWTMASALNDVAETLGQQANAATVNYCLDQLEPEDEDSPSPEGPGV